MWFIIERFLSKCRSVLLIIGKFKIFLILSIRLSILGPLVSSLANRFGCRFVTILGAIIACIAFSLSTVAPNIETLYITYGFLGNRNEISNSSENLKIFFNYRRSWHGHDFFASNCFSWLLFHQ